MNQVVMPGNDGKWIVKPEGEKNAPGNIYDTKKDAIEAAKEIAMGKDNGVIVLRKDGTIENTGGIALDPFPNENNSPEFNEEGDEGV